VPQITPEQMFKRGFSKARKAAEEPMLQICYPAKLSEKQSHLFKSPKTPQTLAV